MDKKLLLRTSKRQLAERIDKLEKDLYEYRKIDIPRPPTQSERMYGKLSVFTRDGKTFTFINVSDLVTNEYEITFSYVAMSDNKIKEGKFFVGNLAGYSVTP